MTGNYVLKKFGLLLVTCAIHIISPAQQDYNSLEQGFINPPESAKPRTWWHWTNSNVTKEGITKDLEWMKRSGIGGMHLADVASGQGQTVEKKITFMSPEWLDAVKHTASEADRLGLEMTIFSSAGWSLTGGPWVNPEQAMKKLVWSEISLNGPKDFTGKLPSPPSFEGPIRNLSNAPKPADIKPGFYKDFIVLAFPTPPNELVGLNIQPVISTASGIIDADALLDDDLNSSARIRPEKDKKEFFIQYTYQEPFTARAITLCNRSGIPAGRLSASSDGVNFTTLAVLPGAQLYRAGKVMTVSFPATTARYFRLDITGAPMRPADVMAEVINPPDTVYTFSEAKLHSGARIHRWEDKAGFYHLFNYEPVKSKKVSDNSVIDPAEIVDLTSLMAPDGTINWKVPAGNWTIMRFGYSLTGARNRPAVPAGSGYEVDKLSREHTLDYIKEYTEPIAGALGTLYGKSLQGVMLDSWEAGMQNWTDNMPEEFSARRGYDLAPFLPCLAGRIVSNSDISDRVLWDFRRTLADMFAENHYGILTGYLNKQGIKTYGEASGVSLEILEDALLCKKYVDIPMGEFWYRPLHPWLMYYQDIRGAASASHVYGKQITAAEAFTGGGFESPKTLKDIGDYWFTQGVNRFVFHTSAHQPLDTKPGNTMVGTHINRNITWAEMAEPFMTYLSRCSHMLQQGKFVADIACLLDEGAPSTMPLWGTGLKPELPDGYDYDYINADVLLNRMTVSPDGRLVLPDGMSYSMLVLPESSTMTLPVIRKVNELVKAGAMVIGPKPEGTPGHSGFPESEKTFSEYVSELWADLDGISRTIRSHAKGQLFWGTPVKTVLEKVGIRPDVENLRPLDAGVNWIHRRTGDADIYFIVNPNDTPVRTELRFRIKGKEPELWDPATGLTEPAGYTISENATTVPIDLDEREARFVVFRKETTQVSRSISENSPVLLATLKGPWEITFSPEMGAPSTIMSDKLDSWTNNSDEGIKYYSGTAVYKTTIDVPASWIKGDIKNYIDLGKVFDIAEVTVNGKSTGILWKQPFRADITGLLRKGNNTLEIKITNQWTNRLIGDQKLAPDKKILNSSVMVWGRGLNESGLLGPVKILKQYNYDETW